MKKVTLSVIAAAVMTVAGAANAGFDGATSGSLFVGKSTVDGGPHVSGRAGIGFSPRGMVDFQGLTASATQTDGIHVLGDTHAGKSTWNFGQVADQDVWFGEWAAGGTNTNWANRTVYYVGDNTGTTVPASGVATYTVEGVNKFNGTNKLAGTFTANFGTQSLNGSIENNSLKVSVFTSINSADASFSGLAFAQQGQDLAFGNAQGHFFGSEAAALAGIATFADSQYDTAYGGTKN